MTQTTEPLAGRGRVDQAAPRSLHAGRPVRYCVEHVFVLSVEREVGRTGECEVPLANGRDGPDPPPQCAMAGAPAPRPGGCSAPRWSIALGTGVFDIAIYGIYYASPSDFPR